MIPPFLKNRELIFRSIHIQIANHPIFFGENHFEISAHRAQSCQSWWFVCPGSHIKNFAINTYLDSQKLPFTTRFMSCGGSALFRLTEVWPVSSRLQVDEDFLKNKKLIKRLRFHHFESPWWRNNLILNFFWDQSTTIQWGEIHCSWW